MKKVIYTKKYFDKFGSGKINYSLYENNPTFKKIISEMKELEFTKGKLLEIGCAEGFFLKQSKLNGFNIYGVDISSYIVKRAKKYLNSDNIYCLDLSQDKLPFKSSYFDIITMLDSLEHIENPQHALREIYRALKNNGLLHIRLPGFKRGLKEKTHVNFYTPISLKILLEKHGLKVIKLGQEGGLLQIPLGIARLVMEGTTNFNYTPIGGKFISCYCIKLAEP